ncbi:hypothetical protein ROLI_037800 [Roseobacter fucihabitans]|uniref:Uncharacterized protein n=1 Tax=Roseobacter fucihabitans TaxID=1537242 RepID=A0ABZ2BZA2_9RHOB|nr:hypothetical protein [Roseobacter litoralis]MBC6967807.1 hypothetical protein [Roseobacter litoralis]
MEIFRQDFLAAIERMRSGNPTNDALKLKVKQGKLKLNNSTVALETSRGLSTLHTAKYSDLKQFISGTRHKPDKTGLLEESKTECRSLQKNLERSELQLSHADIRALQAERALQ